MPATLALLKSSHVLRPHFTFESMQESTLDALFGGGYLSSCTSAFSAKSPGKPNLLLTPDTVNLRSLTIPSLSCMRAPMLEIMAISESILLQRTRLHSFTALLAF